MPPLDALRPSPLVDQAIQRLRAQITQGEWPIGAKLPGETTLATTLGVGRSTVREALRALTAEGLLRPRQGVGVFVIALEPDGPLWLRQAAVADVYEVRMLLEVQAVRLAAERRTPQDRAALHQALAQRRRAANGADDGAFVDADIALHVAAIAAGHNPVLTAVFTSFAPALREGLIELVDLLGLRAVDANPGDATHAGLVAAIEDGDGDEASRILQAELQQTLAQLRR